MQTFRVEKHKWDGTISAVDVAEPLDVADGAVAWAVRAGSVRQRPTRGVDERVAVDEIWLARPGQWWLLCAYVGADGTIAYKVHAAAPFEPSLNEQLVWIDLDLDFDVAGDDVSLQDEAEFHAHARSMSYPEEVVRGAWSGVSVIAARYTNADWPFDGVIQQLARQATLGAP